MRRIFLGGLLLFVLLLYIPLHQKSWEDRSKIRQASLAGYVLPSKFSKILALRYRGLLSDFLLLKTITFIGERYMMGESLSEEDWRYFTQSIEVVTDLDPYFFDPYLLAEGFLTWDGQRIAEANLLLEKGRKYLVNDWRIPYFIGFNYFYFLHDNENGAKYIMEAARLPGSPDFLPTLASRLAYYSGKTKTGVLFLKGILMETNDPRLEKKLKKRLLAMERASLLEDLAEKFRKESGRPISGLKELVKAGYLDTLPDEPYGGKWIIHPESGRVYSTSRFAESPPEEVNGTGGK